MHSIIDDTVPMGKVTIGSFDAASVTADEVVKSLIENGGCFIRNLIDHETVAAMLKQVQPYLEADVPWEGEFFPKETRRSSMTTKILIDMKCSRIPRSEWPPSKITSVHRESIGASPLRRS